MMVGANTYTSQNANRCQYSKVTYENGYNLPIVITNNKECHVAGCAVDLSTDCQCSSSKQGSPKAHVAAHSALLGLKRSIKLDLSTVCADRIEFRGK